MDFTKLCNVVKFFNFLSLIFDSVFRFRDSISRFCIPCELLCAAAAAEFLACVAELAVLCGCELWRRSRVPNKGSRDEAVVVFLAASPLVTAPPPNLTRLLHNTASYAGYRVPSVPFGRETLGTRNELEVSQEIQCIPRNKLKHNCHI